MSFINHLIKRAKESNRHCTLDVPASKVGGLVEHIVACGWSCGRERVRKELLEGNVCLFGCRLRVVGQPAATVVCVPLHGTKVVVPYYRDPNHPMPIVRS